MRETRWAFLLVLLAGCGSVGSDSLFAIEIVSLTTIGSFVLIVVFYKICCSAGKRVDTINRPDNELCRHNLRPRLTLPAADARRILGYSFRRLILAFR